VVLPYQRLSATSKTHVHQPDLDVAIATTSQVALIVRCATHVLIGDLAG
jgi:hypothetical protein